jgi:gluconate 5-dehydrogenase
MVTGAGRGIGRELAGALLRAGASVVLLDRDEATVRSASEALGAGAFPLVCDITDEDAVARAVADAEARLGRLDVLVNNAGVRAVAGFLEHPLEAWRRTLDVNLTGPFLVSRAAIPAMLRQGKAKIINIASTAAELALSERLAYNVSKAGVVMLTKSIAFELGERSVYCNAIAPGVIETDMNRGYFGDNEMRPAILANTPQRRWGTPEDLAGALVFLASDASDFVNGATLFVDGGWMAGKGY